MADNVAITPGTGVNVAADEGTYSGDTTQVQIIQLAFVTGAEGSRTIAKAPGDSTNGFAVQERFIAASATALTRPANVTAYTALDAISNSATAGSVTAQSFTVSNLNDAPVALERMRVATTDTGLAAAKNIRAYLYRADPTASTGVVGGDNAAFSTKQGSFIGAMSGTFKAFSDGGVAVLVPEEGTRIITAPVSGAMTVFALFQAIDAFTPSANSTTLTPTLEGMQGRA
jgi:Na+-transporting NADH:ubiquinone oxidoreductase subunit NqrB